MKEVTEEQRQRLLRECPDCLVPLLWAHHMGNNPGQMPPMEEAGLAYVYLSDGSAVRTMTYRPHECSGERPIGEDGEMILSKEEVRLANQQRSLERVCPKCRAFVGEPCVNLASGGKTTTRWPHEERLEE